MLRADHHGSNPNRHREGYPWASRAGYVAPGLQRDRLCGHMESDHWSTSHLREQDDHRSAGHGVLICVLHGVAVNPPLCRAGA